MNSSASLVSPPAGQCKQGSGHGNKANQSSLVRLVTAPRWPLTSQHLNVEVPSQGCNAWTIACDYTPAQSHKRSMRHVDQVTRADDGVLANDQGSLALVRDLRVMLVDVIQALEDDPAPSGAVKVVLTAAETRICVPER
jgi:hypothetical protein